MPKTDYEKYLNTDTLLSLQKPADALACHDELQFQIVHQVAELWMKLILHELAHVKTLVAKDRLIEAHVLFTRCSQILNLLSDQLRVLNTMSPSEYHKVRTQLGRGSGQESPGFNRILEAGPTLWAPYKALLDRRKVSIEELHDDPEKHPELFLLAEDLFGLDEQFINFRYLHLQLVKRIIGGDVPSLKGVHAEKYLMHGLANQFFPELWAVRNEISRRRGIPVGAKSGLCPYPHGDQH
ncbi:MAG: tryptophan 2,3-dioxygenase [Deltaproteobacteria bacterium]|nr:tryptophan 2,3-dioxygenase [Deltaproteobacteria bacterium]